MNRALKGTIAVALITSITIGAWWVGRSSQTPSQAAARAKEPAASWITAKVEKRALTRTIVIRGDVQPQSSVAIGAPQSVGTSAIVTKLPPALGSHIGNGSVVAEISGRPIIALVGQVPVFRQMEGGTKGVDVRQLQSALRMLGYNVSVSAEFNQSTKDSIKRLYAKLGYSTVNSATKASDVAAAYTRLQTARTAFQAAESDFAKAKAGQSAGKLLSAQSAYNQAVRSLADAKASKSEAVSVANTALRAAQNADQAVLANFTATQSERDASALALLQAQNAVTAATRSGDNAVAAANEQLAIASDALDAVKSTSGISAAQSAVTEAKSALELAQADYDSSSLSFGPTIPFGEIVFVPNMPATVQSRTSQLGAIGSENANGEPGAAISTGIATLTSGGQQVVCYLDSENHGTIQLGDDVSILDEGTQATYKATVTSIAGTPFTDQSGQLSYRAVVSPLNPVPVSLNGQNVRLTFGESKTATPQLVVPITAVSTSSSGTTRVSVLRSGATQPSDVEVVVGTTSDGFVTIRPTTTNALRNGDTVVIGR